MLTSAEIAEVDEFGENLRMHLQEASRGEWGVPFLFGKAPKSEFWRAKFPKKWKRVDNWIQLNGRVYYLPQYASPSIRGVEKRWKLLARFFPGQKVSDVWERVRKYEPGSYKFILGGEDVWGISYEQVHALLTSYGKEGLLKTILIDSRSIWGKWQDLTHATSRYTQKENVVRFAITIEQDEDGFIVTSCPALPGCHSQGRTREEAITNIREAIRGYIASMHKHGERIPRITDVQEVEVAV